MRAATLFTGIGAPETAIPSWEWTWAAEINPFACAVMACQHPEVLNLGDVPGTSQRRSPVHLQ
jgi:site-specific DNA-cytosine methylase